MTDVLLKAAATVISLARMPSAGATQARSADGPKLDAGVASKKRFEDFLSMRIGEGEREKDGSWRLDREPARAAERQGDGTGTPAQGGALDTAPTPPGMLGPIGPESHSGRINTIEPSNSRKVEQFAARSGAPAVDERTHLRDAVISTELEIENVQLATWRPPVRAPQSMFSEGGPLAHSNAGQNVPQVRLAPPLEYRSVEPPESDGANAQSVLAMDLQPPMRSQTGNARSGGGADHKEERESRGNVAGVLRAPPSTGRAPSAAATMEPVAIESSRSPRAADVGSQVVAALGVAIGTLHSQVVAGDGAAWQPQPTDVRPGVLPGAPATQLVRRLRIELDPADLGRVEVQLTLVDGALDIKLRAEVGATARYLGEQSQQITERLEESGYMVEGLRVSQGALEATRVEGAPAAPDEQGGAYRGYEQSGSRSGESAREDQGQRREHGFMSRSNVKAATDAAEVVLRSVPLRHHSV